MKEISLYIHIPFCERKCLYCDFNSRDDSESLMHDYTKSLISEIRNRTNNCVIKTIFVGGGTPSFLNLNSWEILGDTLKSLKKIDNCEFTVECNPNSINKENLSIFRNINVNRLSIGVQSFDSNILKTIGRIHDYDSIYSSFSLARSFGFKNINIDQMYGLPNQNIEIFKNSLTKLVELNPEHISLYSLILEENTKLYKLVKDNKLFLPTEDEEISMTTFLEEFLPKYNYKKYEISNFSKPEYECKHNLVYWNCNEYIGVGVSAHSYVDGVRFSNTDSISSYISNIKNGNSITNELNVLSKWDEIEEFVFLGLRKTEGISIDEFHKKFQTNIFTLYGKKIEDHIKNGLLINEFNRLYLSERGMEISNYVLSDFILDKE